MLRIMFFVILAAGAGWSGLWFWNAHRTEAEIARWFDQRVAEGWVANHGPIVTRGFPNRLDTTITAPELADPHSGLAWQAPELQILSLSYQPHKLIVLWPATQTIGTPVETITVTADAMRASLSLLPAANLEVERAVIESGPLRLASTLGWSAAASHAEIALRKTPAVERSYDLALSLAEVTPPEAWSRIGRRAGLPENQLGLAELEATARFSAPWDLAALEAARPQPQRIDITRSRIAWGDLELQAKGQVDVDDKGRPDGEVTLRATRWREMLTVARDSGALSDQMAGLLEGGLNLIARMSGNERVIDAPLKFRRGAVTLGGVVPLGEAPRLVIR